MLYSYVPVTKPSTAVYALVPDRSDIRKHFYGTGYGMSVSRMTLHTYGRIPYTVRFSALNELHSKIWGLVKLTVYSINHGMRHFEKEKLV